jgi:hypothetical protein
VVPCRFSRRACLAEEVGLDFAIGLASGHTRLGSRCRAEKTVEKCEQWKAMAQKTHYIPYYMGRAETPKRLAALYNQLKDALVAVGMVN